MKPTLTVDFGSTYTKVAAFDLAGECLLGWAQAVSTVDTDITLGLQTVLENLATMGIDSFGAECVLVSSSAAGGLRIVAAGLVPELTTKAAIEASLGAGGKVVGTFPRGLSADDMTRMERLKPDLVMLAGGTDGGDEKTIIHNAGQLAKSNLNSPVIVAGNKMAAQQARSLLKAGNKEAIVVDNVLPELDKLNVEPARAAIRETFVRRIIQAKGLDKARKLVGDIIMPTPMAVLNAAVLLAQGTEREEGLGELIVVDIGGATTDVCSIGDGHPSQADVVLKGLPEPHAKRTVEGDLGIRYNAKCILEMAGQAAIKRRMAFCNEQEVQEMDLEQVAELLSGHIGYIPQSESECALDISLASAAVDIATQRHAGKIEEVYFPTGKVCFQYGKDLTKTGYVIGTGGIFAYGKESRRILQAACYDRARPESLRPVAPKFLVDERYILFAIGLLAGHFPDKALRIIKKHLRAV